MSNKRIIKVLIVDDSHMTRNFHAYILREAGFKIDEASDGYEALEKLLSDKFDIVLTDINMPRMDGYKFIKSVRQESDIKDIPIIIISTEDAAEDKRKGFEAGADFYIVKPVNPDKLIKSREMLVKE